jgi:hypothetical protein
VPTIEETALRLPILAAIALAILPCLSMGAQAHWAHHHRHYFGHHRHGSYFGRSNRHRHMRNHHHRHYRHRYSPRVSEVPSDARGATERNGHGAVYDMVTQSAVQHGLPPSLAHAIVRAESNYNCQAYNHGAAGIMQVRASTARSVGISAGLQSCSIGLEAGMRYLQLAFALARGNAAHAATLYNRGLGARPMQSGYSRLVMRMSSL